jgi:alanyl-tRNA synthetase
MVEDEIKKVEDLVNQKIQENLEVKKEEMSYEQALKSGALAFFKEKYPEKVTVYSINGWSREICAGPHVQKTSELGHFKITKEESSGAGARRIRAVLAPPSRR